MWRVCAVSSYIWLFVNVSSLSDVCGVCVCAVRRGFINPGQKYLPVLAR